MMPAALMKIETQQLEQLNSASRHASTHRFNRNNPRSRRTPRLQTNAQLFIIASV
jgi:hypothetical protein